MHAGYYISGAGHLGLIGWLLLGNVFSAEPQPFEVTEASVISTAEYEALVNAAQAPEPVIDLAQPPAPPAAEDAPEVVASDDVPANQTVPVAVPEPPSEDAPEVAELALPPQTDVADTAPALEAPNTDIAVLTPQIAEQAVPRASDRVAPEAVAPPPPDALPDPVQQDAVSQSDAGDVQRETAEAKAPEEAATEIVTEAEKPAKTMTQSLRPRMRPARAQAPAPSAKTAQADPVAEALAQALAETAAPQVPATPSGPPLSASEQEGLRVAVSSCWNVGSLSSEALGTTVIVSVSMTPDAKPVISSIKLASSSGGSQTAARQAFEAARRAIIRCGARGFDLPAEKYSQWQAIEMTFNPERMRIK